MLLPVKQGSLYTHFLSLLVGIDMERIESTSTDRVTAAPLAHDPVSVILLDVSQYSLLRQNQLALLNFSHG